MKGRSMNGRGSVERKVLRKTKNVSGRNRNREHMFLKKMSLLSHFVGLRILQTHSQTSIYSHPHSAPTKLCQQKLPVIHPLELPSPSAFRHKLRRTAALCRGLTAYSELSDLSLNHRGEGNCISSGRLSERLS